MRVFTGLARGKQSKYEGVDFEKSLFYYISEPYMRNGSSLLPGKLYFYLANKGKGVEGGCC